MAKYTTELRSICEVYAGYNEEQGYNNVNDVIEKALPKIFDFDFPIYDETYRTVLETKIVKHFYTREICCETAARWKLFLNERLNLIMPYYNQLYKSTLEKFNPFYDVDLTTDHVKDNGGNNSNEGHSEQTSVSSNNTDDKYERNLNSKTDGNDNTNAWQYYNDTPQGGINGIETNKYLTNATNNTNSNTSAENTALTGNDNRITNTSNNGRSTANSNTSGKYTDTESYLEHVKGKSGGQSNSKLLLEYRSTFINIDNQIINNLNDLFFNLW